MTIQVTESPRARLVTLLFFIVPPLIMGSVFVWREVANHRANVENRKAIAKISAEWTNYEYTPVKDSSFPDRLLRLLITCTSDSGLSREQKSYLLLSLMQFFRAFNDGTYEAYRDFRIPHNFPYTWTSNFYGYGAIGRVLKERGFPAPLLTNSMQLKLMALLVALNKDGQVYKDYFSAINFEHSALIVNRFSNSIPPASSTPFLPTNFASHAFKTVSAPVPNIGIYSPKQHSSRIIEFENDRLEQLLSEHGNVTVADCLLFLKRRPPDPVLPVILRLYWNPRAMRWLPDDLVTCNTAQIGIQPVF